MIKLDLPAPPFQSNSTRTLSTEAKSTPKPTRDTVVELSSTIKVVFTKAPGAKTNATAPASSSLRTVTPTKASIQWGSPMARVSTPGEMARSTKASSTRE